MKIDWNGDIRKQILAMFHVTEEEVVDGPSVQEDRDNFVEHYVRPIALNTKGEDEWTFKFKDRVDATIFGDESKTYLRPLPDISASIDFKTSEAAMKLMEERAEETRRTLTITHQIPYSRWYRFVIAVLRATYGWIPRYGYKGPPRDYTIIVPGMKVTSMVEEGGNLHVEMSNDSQPVASGTED